MLQSRYHSFALFGLSKLSVYTRWWVNTLKKCAKTVTDTTLQSHPDRGAAATGGNQGKPPYPVLWTQKIFHYFHKIIKELAPSESTSSSTVPNRNYRPHPGTPSNSHDSRPWSTPEYRARFEQRWSYSTRLARWMYNEGLLDQRIFLKYSLDMLATCASFETIWLVLTFLIQDYIDEYKRNRTLTKLLVETLVKVYGAVSLTSGSEDCCC